MWEAIGTFGSIDGFQRKFSSMAHGWSTGAAPALTQQVLGIQPTEPGYARFEIAPHAADVTWAQGQVPTPRGPVRVAWRRTGSAFTARVVVPRGSHATFRLPAPTRRAELWVDGKRRAPLPARRAVAVPIAAGSHTMIVVG